MSSWIREEKLTCNFPFIFWTINIYMIEMNNLVLIQVLGLSRNKIPCQYPNYKKRLTYMYDTISLAKYVWTVLTTFQLIKIWFTDSDLNHQIPFIFSHFSLQTLFSTSKVLAETFTIYFSCFVATFKKLFEIISFWCFCSRVVWKIHLHLCHLPQQIL